MATVETVGTVGTIASEIGSAESADRRQIRLITVHGTFDSQATWDDDGSPLISGLRQKLGEAGATLVPQQFIWSGENDHFARREAADQLREIVEADLENDAYDALYIVGHSHGGTVARLAMNKLGGEKRPDGVFTFGSPFVRFKPRGVGAMVSTLKWLVGGLGTIAALAILVLLILSLISVDNEAAQTAQENIQTLEQTVSDAVDDAEGDGGADAAPPSPDSAGDAEDGGISRASIVLGVSLIGVLGLIWWLNRLLDRWRLSLFAAQHRIKADFDPDEREPRVGYVCFHAIGDEAGVLLRFWGFFTWVLQSAIFLLLFGAVAMLAIGFGLGAVGLVDTLFGTSIWATAVEPMLALWFNLDPAADAEALGEMVDELPWYVLGVAVRTLLALLVLAIVVAPIALLIPPLLRRQYFAFGGEKLSWPVIFDINADRLPGRRAMMETCFLWSALKQLRIQHNYYYEEPSIIDRVGEKILNFDVPDRGRDWSLEQRFLLALRALMLFSLVGLVLGFAATWAYYDVKCSAFVPPFGTEKCRNLAPVFADDA